MKYHSCVKRSQGRHQRFLSCWWDWNRSRGLKPCKLYDGYDDDDYDYDGDGDGDDDDDDDVTKLMLGLMFS
jgi:hypothetical protein